MSCQAFGVGRSGRRRASALLVAIVFVALFGALAAGYLAAANANMKSSHLQMQSRRAQLAAESGLSFARRAVPAVAAHHTGTAAEMLQALVNGLNSTYGSTVFKGQSAVLEGNSIVLPALILNFPEGLAEIQVRIEAVGGSDYVVTSAGGFGEAKKTVYADFGAARDRRMLSRFGVASRSSIVMIGAARVQGANESKEGSILSASETSMTPITLIGDVTISGDVSITNPKGNILISDSCEVGGDIRKGVDAPSFPAIDTTIFKPFATNIVDASTPLPDGGVYENILVRANTNPTFNGNCTILGVVYIESPNVVTFNGTVDLIGVVAVEKPTGSLKFSKHSLRFLGDCLTDGVDALPAGSQFDGLRDMTGSFLLAPGYEVEFSGNFSTINGSILASRMLFSGNAHGTVRGCVINYDETDFRMGGMTNLTIDQSGLNENPSGMTFPWRVFYVEGSYNE